jgi:hypothetical protein
MPTRKKTVVATAMGPVEVDGRTVIVVPGGRFPADAPVVRAHPAMFRVAASSSPRRSGRSR